MAENLTESRRRELFLRACETASFNDGWIPRQPLPWYRIGRNQLPNGISYAYLVELAEARAEAKSGNAQALADLGLVRQLAGDGGEARPLLEHARSMLSAAESADAYVLGEVNE